MELDRKLKTALDESRLMLATWFRGITCAFAFAQTRRISANFERAFVGGASTDEILIERIAHRDQLAMRTLFARHQTRVYRFVLRLV